MGFLDCFCSSMSDDAYDSADQHCSDLADQYDGADQSAEVYADCMAEACWEVSFDSKDD